MDGAAEDREGEEEGEGSEQGPLYQQDVSARRLCCSRPAQSYMIVPLPQQLWIHIHVVGCILLRVLYSTHWREGIDAWQSGRIVGCLPGSVVHFLRCESNDKIVLLPPVFNGHYGGTCYISKKEYLQGNVVSPSLKSIGTSCRLIFVLIASGVQMGSRVVTKSLPAGVALVRNFIEGRVFDGVGGYSYLMAMMVALSVGPLSAVYLIHFLVLQSFCLVIRRNS